jgi:hypothetical protein
MSSGGLLTARRAGNRMSTRQTYRTFNRMERRRPSTSNGPQPDKQMQQAAPLADAPPKPAYITEVEQLAQMHAEGILNTEEYQAKKRQILGI